MTGRLVLFASCVFWPLAITQTASPAALSQSMADPPEWRQEACGYGHRVTSRYQPLKDGVRAGHQELGYGIAFHPIDEFTPELKRVFTWKH
jgi:hypothetical protein